MIRSLALVVFIALAACAPCDGDPTAVAGPCHTTTPCAADRDCPSGQYCNTALGPPVCQLVHCGAASSPCSSFDNCASTVCFANDHCTETAPLGLRAWDDCSAFATGTFCSDGSICLGPTTDAHPASAFCMVTGCTDDPTCPATTLGDGVARCPLGGRTTPDTDYHPCAIQCEHSACPAGYVCRAEATIASVGSDHSIVSETHSICVLPSG